MEIKAKLTQPFTDEERANFVVEYNNILGYEIIDKGICLEAWGYTQEEIEEREKKQKEEFIAHLTCTKRVLVLMLQQLGKDYYTDILPLIQANPQAQMEWDLCVELERCNPLIDSIGSELGFTPKQIDQIFLYANGIVDTLEVSDE